jgi:hypothetical protein
MMAVHDFLLRHKGICTLRFERCPWADSPSSSRQLTLLYLQTLQGYLYQTIFILGLLPLPSALRELLIEGNPHALLKGEFFGQVLRCMAMCKELLALDILLPKQEQMAELTLANARALAAHTLRSTTLPFGLALRPRMKCFW